MLRLCYSTWLALALPRSTNDRSLQLLIAAIMLRVHVSGAPRIAFRPFTLLGYNRITVVYLKPCTRSFRWPDNGDTLGAVQGTGGLPTQKSRARLWGTCGPCGGVLSLPSGSQLLVCLRMGIGNKAVLSLAFCLVPSLCRRLSAVGCRLLLLLGRWCLHRRLYPLAAARVSSSWLGCFLGAPWRQLVCSFLHFSTLKIAIRN